MCNPPNIFVHYLDKAHFHDKIDFLVNFTEFGKVDTKPNFDIHQEYEMFDDFINHFSYKNFVIFLNPVLNFEKIIWMNH